MSARERDRGARAERAVVNFLRENGWPDARRYLAGDGRQPGDVDFHPLVCLEVKDIDPRRSAWPSWCRQAASEARDGMVPVVVRRTRGVPDAGQWECRVEEYAWMAVMGFLPWPGWEEFAFVDAAPWTCTTLAEFVAALHRFDEMDGAA